MKTFIQSFIFLLGIYFLYQYYGEELLTQISNRPNTASNTQQQPNLGVAHSLRFPRSNDGHYWINMNVDNTEINFIVDTGATQLTLSHQDAERLNLYLNENDYTIPVRTAAGMTTVAEITIDRISVGVIELYDVKAFVAREGMLAVSLLGMNFLNRLNRFEFANDTLILEQ
ncbi:retropepsin-like aspartic protease family protein [Pseudemcibacter aquimaris]|uniref:retropepsin-like aspartic protease family protein n=1 Tax=Pseudemcibacter aquimaris TaxID=2857064 RepID=UPI002012EF62|nr:TIGR02281 family clan AA aspartic protease [Pseudemcibacter aquimaris]MCC3861593.1 TIGR02281 family clan AA aspartic protease [Pseudemcibacter aquimaris]WDU58362.1 TIGR02281 family clan AA aspartic protease [Pseudemcibacter aquimaris]